MITPEEKRFIEYWEQNRLRKKKFLWKLAAGLPLGVLLVVAIFVNYLSGWYHRATLEINLDPGGVLVVLLGLLLIVVFMVIFSSRHRWEMNEQRYRELLVRRKKQDDQ